MNTKREVNADDVLVLPQVSIEPFLLLNKILWLSPSRGPLV